ncbi:DUF4249 domain-containing protein [Tunicatimonas pelagia]|uniref:DUF4249 domain-containing protein n=1 Tax=Tunicatimonas pelagia TaxID=931531 RepID=UPI002666E4F4|nr:DUF4249 domain-containing protein [Tunicatimonas pelagia]WKN43986.1 DUF4249 domain-containing protein [Tunicatimonas pelagia]
MRYCTCLLFFCITACETAIETDVPRNPPQLTVNSLFNPDSVWQVELTQNRYILDSEPFASVPDAEVQVLQNGQTVAILDYVQDAPFIGNSIYRAESSYPQTGEDYTLEVNHPTLGSLFANGQAPESQITITRAVLDTLDQRTEANISNNAVAYGLTIQFEDPPEENFYSLSVLLQYDGFFGTEELLLEERSSFSDIRSDDPIVAQVFDQYRDEIIFTDASFNGQSYTLKLYLLESSILSSGLSFPPFILTEPAYDTQGNIVRDIGELAGLTTLRILLRTTTEEYYQYNYTRDLQASVENNPFAQPVQVFDNVEGGLGIFTGFSQMEKKVIIQ